MSNLSNQGIPFYIRELVNSSFYEFVTPRYNAVRAREKRGVYIEIVDDVGWERLPCLPKLHIYRNC